MQRCRLDRFISQQLGISRRDIRLMLAQKRVRVDNQLIDDISLIVDKFSTVCVDDKVLHQYDPLYIMLHKPVGVVSATIDDQHKTVLDLLSKSQYPDKDDLHIVGRLDLNTSGLVLLTNDSEWSTKLTHPDFKVEKQYVVTLKKPLTDEYISAFAQGMYFDYEGITTKPAKLVILSEYVAQVTLTEGRYHQIKRMFGRFRNQVIKLHRSAVGTLSLDKNLQPGMNRQLTTCEVRDIGVK